MNAKISVVLFAVATLLQLSHCIPTHRYIRETGRGDEQDWASKFKEYFSKLQSYGSSSGTQTQPPSSSSTSSTSQPESYPGNSVGAAGAASEPQASIASKDANSQAGGFPYIGNYVPPQFAQYQNQIPQSMYPNQYISSMPGSSGATAGAASEPEAAIATKDANSQAGGFPYIGNYVPAQIAQYQNQIPQSMYPNQYMNSLPGNSGATAAAASEPEAVIATKDNSQAGGIPYVGSYMPNQSQLPNQFGQMGQYQNQMGQFQNQIPSSMNPSHYMGSKPTGTS